MKLALMIACVVALGSAALSGKAILISQERGPWI